MDFQVKISDACLEGMCHAALETYLYGDGHETRKGLEVNGYLWGYRRTFADRTLIFVDRLSPSFSSQKHQNWVKPNQKAIEMQTEFMDRWAPEAMLLGDFHSHPYPDLRTVNAVKGYHFSEGDFEYLKSDEFNWSMTESLPLIIVMTVCKLERVHDTVGKWIGMNIWHWDVGHFRFWLNAAVGYLQNGERLNTGNTHSKLNLDLNTRFFNLAGDRLLPG